jgi:hypothetical protein
MDSTITIFIRLRFMVVLQLQSGLFDRIRRGGDEKGLPSAALRNMRLPGRGCRLDRKRRVDWVGRGEDGTIAPPPAALARRRQEYIYSDFMQ